MIEELKKKASIIFASFVACVLLGSPSFASDSTPQDESPLHNETYFTKSGGSGGGEYEGNVVIKRDIFYKNLRRLNTFMQNPSFSEQDREAFLAENLCTPLEVRDRLENIKKETRYMNKPVNFINLVIDIRELKDISAEGSTADLFIPTCPTNGLEVWLTMAKRNNWLCKNCEIGFNTVGWGPLKWNELNLLWQALDGLDKTVKNVIFKQGPLNCNKTFSTPCSIHTETYERYGFTRFGYRFTICQRAVIDKEALDLVAKSKGFTDLTQFCKHPDWWNQVSYTTKEYVNTEGKWNVENVQKSLLWPGLMTRDKFIEEWKPILTPLQTSAPYSSAVTTTTVRKDSQKNTPTREVEQARSSTATTTSALLTVTPVANLTQVVVPGPVINPVPVNTPESQKSTPTGDVDQARSSTATTTSAPSMAIPAPAVSLVPANNSVYHPFHIDWKKKARKTEQFFAPKEKN